MAKEKKIVMVILSDDIHCIFTVDFNVFFYLCVIPIEPVYIGFNIET